MHPDTVSPPPPDRQRATFSTYPLPESPTAHFPWPPSVLSCCPSASRRQNAPARQKYHRGPNQHQIHPQSPQPFSKSFNLDKSILPITHPPCRFGRGGFLLQTGDLTGLGGGSLALGGGWPHSAPPPGCPALFSRRSWCILPPQLKIDQSR